MRAGPHALVAVGVAVATGVGAALAGPVVGVALALVGGLVVFALVGRRGGTPAATAAPETPRAPEPTGAIVAHALPTGVAVLSAEGHVEYVNPVFARALGTQPEKLVGVGLEVLTGAKEPMWFQEARTATRARRRDVRLLTASRGNLLVEASVTPLPESKVLLLLHDPEDLDLGREASLSGGHLDDPEWFFHSVFDAMEDPITVLDLEGEILQANRAARAVFGRDLIGRKCHRAFRMRETPCDECPARITAARVESTSVEQKLFGNAITRISTYPLFGRNGELRAVINHKRDVTEERLLEELKAGFIAIVSHELRTPLTSIIGFNQLNLRRLTRQVVPALADAPDKVREVLETVLEDMRVMQSEGDRLGRLVNDVLDLSKLEAGRLTLRFGTMPAQEVVDEAIAATSSLWQAKSLDVRASVRARCPAIHGDRDRVTQILVNLLSNAIKFTERGGVEIRVEPSERELSFAVQDSGPGIPADQLPYVFEKFRQVGDTMPGRPQGTGLGLAICRELVALHGGHIWAESRPGHGSTFCFTLPRADVGAPARPVSKTAPLPGIE